MGEQEGRNVPVIDLQRFPSQHEKLRGACEEWGCFRVLNHGISEGLMTEMKAVARSLLDLPMEAKKKKKNVVEGSGYLEPDKAYPLHESLGLWDMGSAQGVDEFCSQSNASPHQKEIMKIYREAVHELAMDMADELTRSTGLSSGRFEDWACQLRLNKHSYGQAWSNGRLCTLKHRVQCKEGRVRVSIGTFVMAPKEADIEAPEEFVNAERPRLYAPISFTDYK